jgi:hypothetical protein
MGALTGKKLRPALSLRNSRVAIAVEPRRVVPSTNTTEVDARATRSGITVAGRLATLVLMVAA